jgi:hypothetical protein
LEPNEISRIGHVPSVNVARVGVAGLGREGAGVASTPHGKVRRVAKWTHNEIFEMGTFDLLL